jgi:hypothetical protein
MIKYILILFFIVNSICHSQTVVEFKKTNEQDPRYLVRLYPNFAYYKGALVSETKITIPEYLNFKNKLLTNGYVMVVKSIRTISTNTIREDSYTKSARALPDILADIEKQKQDAAMWRDINESARREYNTFKVDTTIRRSDGSWSKIGKYQGGTVIRRSDGSWTRFENN